MTVFSLVAVLSLGGSQAWAALNFGSATLNANGNAKSLVLPVTADRSPVISLGSALDPQTGKRVEGIAFVHYKKGFSHKPGHNPGGGGGSTTCYAYLASGTKWKTQEPWVMNPANLRGLDETATYNLQDGALAKWESAAGAQIFGSGSQTGSTLVADETSPDSLNEIYFGSIAEPDVIAVTIVWGIFGGPPFQRQLVEWDQVYDQEDFDWSLTGESGKMDFDNIATHEDGHGAGMGHPPSTCVDETMYAFATEGETKKRDLNAGDIAGINKLY